MLQLEKVFHTYQQVMMLQVYLSALQQMDTFITVKMLHRVLLAHHAKGNVSFLQSVGIRRLSSSSINFSHFNLLL